MEPDPRNKKDTPFHKNWKIYVIGLAAISSTVVSLGSILMLGTTKNFAGLVFWVILTVVFYKTLSSLMKKNNHLSPTKLNAVSVVAVLVLLLLISIFSGLLNG